MSVDVEWEQGNTKLEGLGTFRDHACAFFPEGKGEMKDIFLSAACSAIFYCPVGQSPAVRTLFVSGWKPDVDLNAILTHPDFLSSKKGWGVVNNKP